MTFPRFEICLTLIGGLMLLGCSPSKNEQKTSQQVKQNKGAEHDHASHEGAHLHYGAGPHGGTVIELGGDDYHAEIVLDHDGHAVRVFLFKADAKTPLVTKAADAVLSLDANKKLILKPIPLGDDQAGHTSSFELVDETAVEDLYKKGFLHGDLSVPVGDQVFKSHLDIHIEHGEHKHADHDDKKSK
ncbi:MAG: hypothetical protein JWP89_8 [Schlesneria sp.]|nr:hypothetical protein [Schlesneria sp.]